MKKLRYQPPRHYKVCVNELHSFLLESISKYPHCAICQIPWSKCIDYCILGLNFENWFLSQKCKQLMVHWDDKTSWLNLSEEAASGSLTELWHSTRFQELSYFGDSSKSYLLPDKCTFCISIISASQFSHALSSDVSDNTSEQVSTMYSFVPVDQLPRDCPHKMDDFLLPLSGIRRFVHRWSRGILQRAEVPGHSPANDIDCLRVTPLLATADSKAHAEIGLTASGGRKGCRRCNVTGEYLPEKHHYYYGNMQ